MRVLGIDTSCDETSVAVMDLGAAEQEETPIDLSGISLVDSVSFARLPVAN